MAYFKRAKSDSRGVNTFYVSGQTQPEYCVKFIRVNGSRWVCNCPNFFHQQQVFGHHCKHIKVVKALIRAAGGLRNIPRGVEVNDQQTVDSHVICSWGDALADRLIGASTGGDSTVRRADRDDVGAGKQLGGDPIRQQSSIPVDTDMHPSRRRRGNV